jgi:uncharacterized protein YciI
MALFAVIRSRGPAWDHSRPLEAQVDWDGHAAFMNGLQAEGFVRLGGTLDDTPDTLLIVEAEKADAIRARLAADPWSRSDLLRVIQITPWTLRLGTLPVR